MEKKEDLDFQRKTEEIKLWIADYYLARGFGGLNRAASFSQTLLMKTTFVSLLILLSCILVVTITKVTGYLYWLIWGIAMVMIWILFFFSRRKFNAYWSSKVSIGKQLRKKILEATEGLSPLTYDEHQEIIRLMNLSRASSTGVFRKELKDAL